MKSIFELSSLFSTLENKVSYCIQQNVYLFTTFETLLFNSTKTSAYIDSQLSLDAKKRLNECYTANHELQQTFSQCSNLFDCFSDYFSLIKIEQINVQTILEDSIRSHIERNDNLSDKMYELDAEKNVVLSELSRIKAKFVEEGGRLKDLDFLIQSLSKISKCLHTNSSVPFENIYLRSDNIPTLFEYITGHDYYFSQVENSVLEFAISSHQKSVSMDSLKYINNSLITMLYDCNSFPQILHNIEICLLSARKELAELRIETANLRSSLLVLSEKK